MWEEGGAHTGSCPPASCFELAAWYQSSPGFLFVFVFFFPTCVGDLYLVFRKSFNLAIWRVCASELDGVLFWFHYLLALRSQDLY